MTARSLVRLAAVLAAFSTLCPAPAGHAAVTGTHGMVVSADSLASAAGCAVLRGGGNAVDAAVATGFALAVTFPEAGNIGGGGFMVIRMADGRTGVVDFREKAPGRARRGMFLDEGGEPIAQKSLLGPLSTGVPGTVAGFLRALESFGTRTRKDVLFDAIRLAENGFVVRDRYSGTMRKEWGELSQFPSTIRVFGRQGRAPASGDTLRQPDLARTLRAVAEWGREGFYAGEVAAAIVAEMERGGGLVSNADLASYEPVMRPPLRGTYRGYEVITAPPPSSGGILLLQILNFMELSDVGSLRWNSVPAVHLLASACQRAFADRMAYLGDPDFVRIPTARLISKEYAAGRRRGWDSLHAAGRSAVRPGTPARESSQTTHFCVIDRWGNAVSVTYTLNGTFGYKAVVKGAGFFLNNEMDDFMVKPGRENTYGLPGGEPNSIEPGKRMLSSMSPTILVKEGKAVLLLGARGGSRIPTTTAQIISNVVDFVMDIATADRIPRVHHQWIPDELQYEPGALEEGELESLRTMGYPLRAVAVTAAAEAIQRDPGTGVMTGGPDPREHGVAVGY
jgi:gamma-glutamyltranspeptidase/glutathione hydrolase